MPRRYPALAAILVAILTLAASAQPAPATDPLADLKTVVGRVQQKLLNGVMTPEPLQAELAELDRLAENYRKDAPDRAALVLMTKATLYVRVFADMTTGEKIIRQIAADFPNTEAGRDAVQVVAQLDEQNRVAAVHANLIGKPAPALNFTWASRPGLTSLADLKGKVVILDFWATWCQPCLDSFPQIAAMVQRYKNSPVEIVGVTSLQGRVVNLEARPIDTRGNPAKETGLMPEFMKAKAMTWTVAFSSQEVMNPDYGVNGIPSMVIIAPDGTVRHAGLHPAMPDAEKIAMIDAILTEFGMKTP